MSSVGQRSISTRGVTSLLDLDLPAIRSLHLRHVDREHAVVQLGLDVVGVHLLR